MVTTMRIPLRASLAACAVLTLLQGTGCAGKQPVLYPNRALVSVGSELAQDDVRRCVHSAEGYGLDTRRAERVAERTVERGAMGGAAGAAGGAVLGNAGRGAATGAAAGAAAGFVRGVFRSREPDPLHKRYVEICLRSEGYQVIGWK
jgi:hypothetical protein